MEEADGRVKSDFGQDRADLDRVYPLRVVDASVPRGRGLGIERLVETRRADDTQAHPVVARLLCLEGPYLGDRLSFLRDLLPGLGLNKGTSHLRAEYGV